ncbi:DegT/DnrJ/EryC1/StrS family aminotransferase [Desulforamulus putei]|uniref:dTDP-4-amino-4,6-dideoxygalactose transaminase n=1 Tax=Desulforamulus putei DSM 12395 TaxID=1121429 RepID=A0A1M5B4T8_9FIRM|nr:DegT/DnrJ/EryC1/StrS family aminotransferase [Desulforamulus putei]SHF37465.1 dTDP-4-amino-4,6-dideoxygalactose transaminase [Desulforamulus putei DSM 12395]
MNNREQKVREFETAFANYIGAKYAVAVANSTAALHAALYAAGVSHKDEVILSPLAHPEVAHAIRYLDGVPIYTDVDPQTGCLDPAAVKWRISDNTKAVIATHYAGQPCDMEGFKKLIEGKDIVLIEDASQALGATYKGLKIGTVSPLTVFDFSHPQGVCTELGGMVVTNSEEYYHWLTLFRDTGMKLDKEALVKDEGPWHFEAQEIGFNYRMTSMQAEIGLRQLQEANLMQARRREMAAAYYEALKGEEGLELPLQWGFGEPAWYSFPILLKGQELVARRRQIVEKLLEQGIPVGVQFYPIYLHPIYLWQGHPDICTIEGPLCPQAEVYYSRVINLPTFPNYDDQMMIKTVRLLKEALAAGKTSGTGL